jgi:putative RecB family exonuclease
MKEYESAWDKVKLETMDTVSGPPMRKWSVALADAGCLAPEIEGTLKRLATIYSDPAQEKEYSERGVKILENYFKDNQTNPNRIIAVEKPLNVVIKGLDIISYIDRIEKTPEGEIEIVNYKTARPKDKETIMLGGDTQAIIYTMLLEKKWKRKLKNFYFYYLENRKKIPCNPRRSLLDKTFSDLSETAKKIKYQKFDPSPGPMCGWCDYEVLCSAWQGPMQPYKGILRKARQENRMTFSYSKMSLYRNCPYTYKKLYIDKVPPKPKNFFSIGHSCHEALEEFFTYPYQPSLKQLRKMYLKHWHSEGYKDTDEEAGYFEDGWKWLEEYYAGYIDGKYIKADKVEFYFQLPIGDSYVIIGYLDRLQKNPDGTYEVFDYKTDPKLRTQEEVDKDLQLTSYYWAMDRLGIKIDRLSLEFLEFNKRISTTRSPEDISAFIDEVNRTVAEMARREKDLKKHPEKADELFPPKINKYCGGCDHLEACPRKDEIMKDKEQIMNLHEEPLAET